VVRREKHDLMATLLKLATPVVGRAAGFHYHRSSGILQKEQQELVASRAVAPADVARPIGHAHFEHRLCNVDCDHDMVRHDGLLLLPKQQRLWHIDAH
jgi:hypothetical protein